MLAFLVDRLDLLRNGEDRVCAVKQELSGILARFGLQSKLIKLLLVPAVRALDM